MHFEEEDNISVPTVVVAEEDAGGGGGGGGGGSADRQTQGPKQDLSPVSNLYAYNTVCVYTLPPKLCWGFST